MAIIIPSSKTYNRQNPKVRDNIIERIEVSAVKAKNARHYNERIYGETATTENLWGRGSALQDNILGFYTQGFTSYINNIPQGIWIAGVGGGVYPIYKTMSFAIPKSQSNKLIEKIFFGQTDGKNEIKSTITYDYSYYGAFAKISYDSSKGEYYLSYLNGYTPQKGAERKSSDLLEMATNIGSSMDMGTDGTKYLSVNIPIIDNTNIATAKVDYDAENDTYNLSLVVLCGLSEFKVVFGEEGSFESLTDGEKPSVELFRPRFFSLSTPPTELSNTSGYGQISKGYIIDYKPLSVEISLYGDTIKLDVTDEILYINGKTAKKVHSIDGNELMQTDNYKNEQKILSENIDYWVGKSSTSSQTYFYTSVHLYNEYPLDTYVEYTTPSGTTGVAVIKAFENTHSPAIESTGAYVTINRVYRPLVSTTYEYFKQTQQDYAKGKETATIRCSIGDYFDYDSGEKLISIDNSTGKMSFNIGDEVVPMVFGADGNDTPMSLTSSGLPKKFSVLGSKIYYDGAVWQEISLQEGAETFYSIKYLSGDGVNQNGDNGYKFDVKGQGIIYLKKADGGLHWLADINSTTSIQEVTFLSSDLKNITPLEEYLSQQHFFADFVFKGNFSQVSTGDDKRAGSIGKVGKIESVYSYDGLAGATYVEMFHYKDVNAYTTFPSHIVRISTKTFYYAENPTNLLTIPKTIKTIEPLAFGYSEITKIKFLHGEKDKINLPTAGSVSGMFYSKNAKTMTIYTDNLTIKNYDWVTDNITPTFLHIDGTEWE